MILSIDPPVYAINWRVILLSFYPNLLCACLVIRSCLILCNPMDCSPPSSSVHGIFLAKILEWVTISSSRESSRPRDWTHVSWFSCIFCNFFLYIYIIACCDSIERKQLVNEDDTWKVQTMDHLLCSVVQSCLTLCDPVDCSPPGSSVHGISLAKILEWVTISWTRDWTHISCIGRQVLYCWATRGARSKRYTYLKRQIDSNKSLWVLLSFNQ